jgi:hypothetical protein
VIQNIHRLGVLITLVGEADKQEGAVLKFVGFVNPNQEGSGMIHVKSVRCLAMIFIAAASLYAGRAEKPNIIIAMADNMRRVDLGCHGFEIEMPNLYLPPQRHLLFTDVHR